MRKLFCLAPCSSPQAALQQSTGKVDNKLRLARKTLQRTAALPRAEALTVASSLYVNELMQSADALEGLRAYVEKRPPVWRHQ